MYCLPSEKRSAQNEEKHAPLGSQFFVFLLESFSEGKRCVDIFCMITLKVSSKSIYKLTSIYAEHYSIIPQKLEWR